MSHTVVIDNGSYSIKAGFGDDLGPRLLMDHQLKWSNVFPIQNGVIRNWNVLEQYWDSIFKDSLQIQSNEATVLMTEAPHTTYNDKETTTQIIFETFDVPQFYPIITSILALYASGSSSGTVLECGHGYTCTVPIYEGYCLKHAIVSLDISGQQLSQYLTTILLKKRALQQFNDNEQTSIIKQMKENHCYILNEDNSESEVLKSNECYESFTLPDGKCIQFLVGNERYEALECLFDPSYFFNTLKHPKNKILIDGYIRTYYNRFIHDDVSNVLCKYAAQYEGIHELVYKCIMKLSVDLQHNWEMYRIVLSGGSSMFKGFADRLQKETRLLFSSAKTTRLRICASQERKWMAWIGGSILSTLEVFQENWITKKEYYEVGPSVVHRKQY